MFNEENKLIAATLNQLIIRLTHQTFGEPVFVKTFLTTYQSYATPTQLLNKLLERFNIPKNKKLEDSEKNQFNYE